MKEIDTKLTTTSMKLVEEKKLLRKKEHLKARLKDIASIESSLQEHLQLKVRLAQAVDKSIYGRAKINIIQWHGCMQACAEAFL